MKFTFGIVSEGQAAAERVSKIVQSIIDLKIPKDSYEIIIIGGEYKLEYSMINHIRFDESIRGGWITRKKNMITENASFDNIVYMHDYFIFMPGWYESFLEFGEDFKVCMNRILDKDGNRYRDWCLWPSTIYYLGVPEDIRTEVFFSSSKFLLPYDVTDLSKFMYISGAYWVAKKSVMEEFPLDEELGWAQGEDVKWSEQVREKYTFSINSKSSVKIIEKDKLRVFNDIDPRALDILRSYK